jgi:four helix bundle protein
MSNDRADELQKRLIRFAARVIPVAESLPGTKTGRHISGQMIWSGTAPSPNHAEARDAESRSDFIHKVKIVLKELRETQVWLLLIVELTLVKPIDKLNLLIEECDELISIFVQSAKTARENRDS